MKDLKRQSEKIGKNRDRVEESKGRNSDVGGKGRKKPRGYGETT
jgi:hypothetical protein